MITIAINQQVAMRGFKQTKIMNRPDDYSKLNNTTTNIAGKTVRKGLQSGPRRTQEAC